MNFVIVYFSRFGNGKKLVDHLAGRLKEKGEIKAFRTEEANPAAMPDADLYVFSAPAEVFNLQKDMRKFMKKLAGMEGKKYALVNTHAMVKNRLPKMVKLLSKKGMIKVAEVDFRVTGDSRSGNGLPEGWEKKLDGFVGKL